MASAPVQAEDKADEAKFPENRIGALSGFSSRYPGSNTFSKFALPDVDVTVDKRLFINTDNGAGAYLINENGWTFGPSVFMRLGRYQLTQSNLQGLHTIKTTPQLRLSGGYDFGQWDISMAVARDVGVDSGQTFEIKTSATLPVFDKLFAIPSLSVVAGDRQYMSMWYGISTTESARTRYSAYRPHGGFESVGGSLSLIYRLDQNWAPFVKTDLRYLVGPAGDSPLTMNRLQAGVGVGLSYLFD